MPFKCLLNFYVTTFFMTFERNGSKDIGRELAIFSGSEPDFFNN